MVLLRIKLNFVNIIALALLPRCWFAAVSPALAARSYTLHAVSITGVVVSRSFCGSVKVGRLGSSGGVMLALVARIDVLLRGKYKDVDGRDKPGHEWEWG